MYLVDDMLYKKIIHPETNLINSNKLPTQTVNTIFKKSDDFKSKPTPQSTISILDSGNPPPPVMNITDPAPSPPPSADTYMDQTIIAGSNQPPPPQPDPDKSNKNKDETGDGEPVCSCFNPPNPGKKRKRGVMKAPPRKRTIPQTEENDEDPPTPKRRKMNPLKADTPEDEYDWDNDPEINEMRERFNKIKYDINYPPPKTPRLKKTKKGSNVKNTVTYLCSICNTYFKHRHQLTHHISVLHPSFSQAAETPVSGGNQPPKLGIMREKKMLELKRGTKRKSTQEKPHHKKTKTDGRQKRKSNSQDPPSKKRKSEFGCGLCYTFLKSEKALRRHEENVHDFPNENRSKLKRKRNDTTFSGTYLKRQKTQPHPPVLYQNYF